MGNQELRKHIVERTRAFVKAAMEQDSSGHDWWHIERVTRTAKLLAELEQAAPYICEMAALLHDIADEKLNDSKESGMKKVVDWLDKMGVEAEEAEHILLVIGTMSYGGGGGEPMKTLEGRVVQDADRLDAIGAIASARTFAYSGWKGQAMYDPAIRPRASFTKEQYRKEKSTAVNHFFEKLFKLKALMNTEAAKVLAEERHLYMEQFVAAFDAEWELGNPRYLEESVFMDDKSNRVHIVFHPAAASVLRLVARKDWIVTLGDNQVYGPLQSEERYGSLTIRQCWLDEHVSTGEADLAQTCTHAAIQWRSWPARLENKEVVVWAGASVFEQVNLRRLMAALPDTASVFIIHSTSLVAQWTEGEIRYVHTGEISIEHIRLLATEAVPVSMEEKRQYAADWRKLLDDNGLLRIQEGGQLRTVGEEYWDAYILDAVRLLQPEGGKLMPVMRLVGHVYSHMEQPVTDDFILYRIRTMIAQGTLVSSGTSAPVHEFKIGLPNG